MMDVLMQGSDRDLVKIWQKMKAKRFDSIMLKTKTVGAYAALNRWQPLRKLSAPEHNLLSSAKS